MVCTVDGAAGGALGRFEMDVFGFTVRVAEGLARGGGGGGRRSDEVGRANAFAINGGDGGTGEDGSASAAVAPAGHHGHLCIEIEIAEAEKERLFGDAPDFLFVLGFCPFTFALTFLFALACTFLFLFSLLAGGHCWDVSDDRGSEGRISVDDTRVRTLARVDENRRARVELRDGLRFMEALGRRAWSGSGSEVVV